MKSTLPGMRLRRVLRPWLSPTLRLDVLDPAIADLQYEAQLAHTTTERRHIIVRGYVAILRALVLSIEPAGATRAAGALSLMCGVGALLLTTARAASVDGRVVNSAILAPGMLTPVILRLLGTTSAHRLFAGSLVVATFTPALADGVGLNAAGTLWTVAAHAIVVLVVFAPMAAAAAIVARLDFQTVPQRAVAAVSVGSGIATAALLIARWQGTESVLLALAAIPFDVTLFAVLFALTLLPLLLLARAFIGHPALLAVVSLVCSPLPVLAGAYIDHGTLAGCLAALRHTPFSFAEWSLPFLTGAIGVGWMLPQRST